MRYPLAPPPHPQATTNSSQPVSTLFATSTPAAANAGNRDPFPAYLEMFAFPEGVRLKSSSSPAADDIMASIGPEEAVYHSFVTTDSSGQRSYGVCLTCYQPIPVSLHPLMRSMIERWTKQQFQSSDIEYATHIQQKLTSERTVFQSTGDETVQEMIHLYRGLLEPYNKALMSADQLYGPVCVGMLSRWPMYGLFRDWLVRLMSEIRLKGSLNAPLERFHHHIVITYLILSVCNLSGISLTWYMKCLYRHPVEWRLSSIGPRFGLTLADRRLIASR
jgi:hypothetical protein